MSIDISVVFWTIVNFCLLSVLLNRFLYQPVTKFMRQRQSRIEAGIQAGEEIRQRREAEGLRLRSMAADALREEAEHTRAEEARHRRRLMEQTEQAVLAANQQRALYKESLAWEREQWSQKLNEKIPALTADLSRKFLEPLAGNVSLSGPMLHQELFTYLEQRQAEEESTNRRRPRQTSRRANAMREGNPELDRLAEALAAELPGFSSAIVKKIMGTME